MWFGERRHCTQKRSAGNRVPWRTWRNGFGHRETQAPHNFSFCFSAARLQISRRTVQHWPAPLKNKKKIISGVSDYKQVIPTGFKNKTRRPLGVGLRQTATRGLWVITSAKEFQPRIPILSRDFHFVPEDEAQKTQRQTQANEWGQTN
jgi:hypothetical protein